MVGGNGNAAGLGRFAVAALRPAGAMHPRHATRAQKVLGFVALVALNVALFVAPIDYAALGAFAYAGTFLLTLLANAAVVVPVPYIPIVAHISQTAGSPHAVVVIAALGSACGESVAFFVGRVETELFTGHAWYDRLERFFRHEWRAFLFLLVFAMPLNPIFDVGGLAAGALGIRFRTFFTAVALGRVVRFAVIAYLAALFIG